MSNICFYFGWYEPGLAGKNLPDLFPPSWGKNGEKQVKTMFFPLLRGKNPGNGEKPIFTILVILSSHHLTLDCCPYFILIYLLNTTAIETSFLFTNVNCGKILSFFNMVITGPWIIILICLMWMHKKMNIYIIYMTDWLVEPLNQVVWCSNFQ